MVNPELAKIDRIHLRLIGWIAVLFGSWALFLLLLQGLFGRQVDQLQVVRRWRESWRCRFG